MAARAGVITVNRWTLLTIVALTVLLAAQSLVAAALPPYKPPYAKITVGGSVAAEYFDGSRLWVVYTTGEETHIALYVYKAGVLVNSWVSTVPGAPLATAVTDDLSLLAVATSKKKIVVFDVGGRPVLMLERGVRGTPQELSIAKLDDRYILIIIDRLSEATMWAYAYDLEDHTAKRAEMLVQLGGKFILTPIHVAGEKTGLPQVALLYTDDVSCKYQVKQGNVTINITAACTRLNIELFQVVREPDGSLAFQNLTNTSILPGREIDREPFRIVSLDYAYVYYVKPLRRYYAAVGATLQQVYIPQLTSIVISGDIYALFVIDLDDGRSITRYADPRIGTLDFYPLGNKLLSYTVSYTGQMAAAGSSDFNLYILRVVEDWMTTLYSVSLGSPVTTVAMSPLGDLVIAGSSEGELYAINTGTGDVYWSIPATTPVTSVSLVEGYAAFGTFDGTVFAFRDPRVKLYYLGVRLNLTNAPEYVLRAPVSIRLVGVYDGLLVEENTTGLTSSFVGSIWYTLLPSTNYTLTIDHVVLGVAVYSLSLSANAIYTLQPENFKLPVYNITICLLDIVTGKPPADAIVELTRIPYPGANESIETYSYPVPREGCLYALLPRGYYTVKLLSWRYPPEIPGVNETIKLWNNTVMRANVTPYMAPSLTIMVTTSYGMPLAGANVTLVDRVTGYMVSMVTGGSGSARTTNLPYGVYDVKVSFPYAYPASTSIKVNESRDYQLSVTLKPRTYIVALSFVEAGTGAPVKPVTVEIVRPIDGFRIERTLYAKNYIVLSLEYGVYEVRINATGYRPLYTRLVVDRDASIKLELIPIYYSVEIRVVDAIYQRPMPSRLVILNPYYGSRSVVNAPTGVASLTLHAGNYTLLVYPYYGYPAKVNITVPAVTSVTVQVKPRNYTIRLIPVDAPTGAKISIIGYKATGFIQCSDTGNWSLEWVGDALQATLPYSRGCTLFVKAPHYEPYTMSLESITSNTTIVAKLMPITYVLSISVRSAYGIRINFNVTVKGGPFNETLTAVGREGSANINLRPGNYTVIIRAPYHEPIVKRVEVEGDTQLSVRLPLRVYRVQLRILDEMTGTPVEKAEVTIQRTAPVTGRPETIIVEKGMAIIPLTWGTYRIQVVAKGYEDAAATLDVPRATSATIAMKPMVYTLRLRIIDALSKKPVQNVTVEITGLKSGMRYTEKVKGGSLEVRLRSDTYYIVVVANHYLRYDTKVELLSQRELKIELKPVNYNLLIKVYDGFSQKEYRGPLWVYMERVEGGYKNNVTAKGPEVALSAPYGTYKLVVGAPRYEKFSKNIKLEANMVKKPLIAALNRIKYSVTVKVLDPRGPVPNAIVEFTSVETGATVYTGLTNEEGSVTATLPWGVYKLKVTAGGYHPYETVVEVRQVNQLIPVTIRPTIVKLVLDLLPAIIIAGAVVGSAVWIGLRVRKKPVGLELLEEETG